jgi:hypothetical protein
MGIFAFPIAANQDLTQVFPVRFPANADTQANRGCHRRSADSALFDWSHRACARHLPRTTAQARGSRDSFIHELHNDVGVYPYTKETAPLAGKIDGEQQSRGIIIPFGDLLIGATALEVGYSMLTANVRHFLLIPGLTVVQL